MRRSYLQIFVALCTFGCLHLSLAAEKDAAATLETKSATVASTTPSPNLALAADKFNAHEFDRALELLRAAFEVDPSLPPPQIILVEWFSQAKLPDGIRPSLEAAVEETPDDPEAHVLLAEAALSEGRLAEANLLLERAQQLLKQYSRNPNRKTTLENRVLSDAATLAEKRGKWQEVKDCLLTLQQREPKSPDVLRRLGITCFRLNEDTEARRLFEQAASIDTNALPAGALMAQLYQTRGDTRRVRSEIATALAEKPEDAATLVVAAQLRLQNGEFDEAQQAAEKLLASDADQAAVLKLLGSIALFQKMPEKAEEHFQKVVVHSPNDFEANDGLALALCEQKSDADALRRAVEYARANLQRTPNSPQAIATMAWTLFLIGEIDAAAQLLHRLTEMGNISANAAYYMANISLKKGNTPQAVAWLTAALDTTPNFTKRDEATSLLGQLK